mgnify:CR=1 FL=1
MIGQVELALRVAAGLFVIVAPTLLFLGLWRGLELLQDDDLVERVRDGEFDSPSTGMTPSVFPDSGGDTRTCQSCGTPNLADARFCQECLGKLSSP